MKSPRARLLRSSPGPQPIGARFREERLRVWAIGLCLLLFGTFGAFALGRLAAGTLLIPATLSGPTAEAAPSLVAMELEDARREAQKVAGGLDVLGVAYAADVDSGRVLVQYPTEGLPVERGKPIEVLVSAGRGSRRVPDVTGLPQAAAVEAVKSVGVREIRVRQVADPGSEKGIVVSTAPAAGSPLGESDSVLVMVGEGGGIVEVPNLAGKTTAEAATILQGVQLTVGGTTFAKGEEDSPGELVVVGQDPPAGGLAETGTAVDLRLGKAQAGSGE